MGKPRYNKGVDGHTLRAMFGAATSLLERNAAAINALNVFPVPDGDTGTNMLLTMRATMEEAAREPSKGAGAVSQAMAKGALMGARGNSGVILSQILRGMANALQGKETFHGAELAVALREASTAAYLGIAEPVEGTILTVIREASEAAEEAARANGRSVVKVLETTVEAARASVVKTQHLLPVLEEAGVIDAGGQGLYVMLEGALRHLKGMPLDEGGVAETEVAAAPAAPAATKPSGAYGHCTEFLLQGKDLDLEGIRNGLVAMGESLMVVGDRELARVHIHTFSPEAVLSYASGIGAVQRIKVQDMGEQHRDFLASSQPGQVAVVAVASGDGLRKVFLSLGAAEVVPGGETMNPSVQDLLNATRVVAADKVILLPNNGNIIPAALQASALATKTVQVAPTETIPQGLAAMVAYNREASLEDNLKAMEDSRRSVRSGKITTAIRSTRMGDITVRKGQFIGLIDEGMVAASDSIDEALREMVKGMEAREGGLITLYYGSDSASEEAERLAASLRSEHPGVDVEVVDGGQPHYAYLISVE